MLFFYDVLIIETCAKLISIAILLIEANAEIIICRTHLSMIVSNISQMKMPESNQNSCIRITPP
jgi:hypothetical protein